MKILFLTDRFPPEQTTVGKIVRRLALQVQRGGHTACVVTTTRKKEEEGECEHEGVRVVKIYSDYHDRWRSYLSLYNPYTVKKVQEIISGMKPDIVHAHNIHHHLSYHCLKLAKQSGAKVSLTAHDVMLFHYGKLVEFINSSDLSCAVAFNYKVSPWQQILKFKKRYNPFRNLIIKYYLRYADTIFAVSNALKDALDQNGIGRVEVLHNALIMEEWQLHAPFLERFKEEHHLHDKKIVFFGGRLSETKGGHQAISAMAEVVKNVPTAVLLIAGAENAYTDRMRSLAKELGIGGHLVFTGWLSGDQLKAAYHSASVVIAPSICFDSFPTVILEAMACGKPVVATCFGGAKEMVAEGKSGYIVNPFNTSLLAERIADLLSDPTKSKCFGDAGHERIDKEFNLEKQVKKILE